MVTEAVSVQIKRLTLATLKVNIGENNNGGDGNRGCVSADQEADLATLKVNIGGHSNGEDGNRGCVSADQ